VSGDGGAGSVLVLAVVAVLSVIGLATVVLVGGLAQRQRLATVTDVAALTAARTMATDPARACDVARTVADVHDVGVRRCEVRAQRILVELGVSGPWGIELRSRAAATQQISER
jgi:secretion/DNA translocation related TadE-like protein